MGFRLYDPEIGRFLAIDPLLDIQPSQTPYHYCFNNPTSFTDPTGLYPEKEKGDKVQVSVTSKPEIMENTQNLLKQYFNLASITSPIYEEQKSFMRAQWEQEYLARISMPGPCIIRVNGVSGVYGIGSPGSSSGRTGTNESENGVPTPTDGPNSNTPQTNNEPYGPPAPPNYEEPYGPPPFVGPPEPGYDNYPHWMGIAADELGECEYGSEGNNDRISEYHASTTGGTASEVIAWCSSFVNWTIESSGLNGTNSKAAQSWNNWGVKSTDPFYGAIGVIKTPRMSHVGFVAGKTAGNSIVLLGGNQGDCVSYSSYSRSSFVGFYYPNSMHIYPFQFILPLINVPSRRTR